MSNTKESVVLKYDDIGIPSIMLKVENTAKTPEEADRMFFVRGVEYDAVYLSRFVNCVQNGRAYSLPLMDPKVSIDMDDAIAACRKKGAGWHLMTAIEWNWLRKHTNPDVHGNTWKGHYHNDETEVGIKAPNTWRTLTGSGPASWFHNGNKETGVADVVGLVWKMIAGMRLKNGVFQYMPDNDAAHPEADLSERSQEFKEVYIDDLPFPDPVKIGPGEDGLMITTSGEVEGWDAVRRRDVVVDLPADKIPEILKDLGIITEGMDKDDAWFAADASLDEAVCYVSGSCNSTSSAGPSALSLGNPRSGVGTLLGFFSACLGEPVIR